MSTSLKLGDYNFDPVPLMSIEVENLNTPAGCKLGVRKRASFSGTLINITPKCDPEAANSDGPLDLMKKMQDALCSCETCFPMALSCGEEIIFQENVRVENISFQEGTDNWTVTIPVSVTVSWLPKNDDPECESCITEFTEDWNISPAESLNKFQINKDPIDDEEPELCLSGPSYYQVSRTLNATGVECCDIEQQFQTENGEIVLDEDGNPVPLLDDEGGFIFTKENCLSGFEVAKNFVCSKIDEEVPSDAFSGCMINIGDTLSICNRNRTVQFNKCNGTYSITENFLICDGTPEFDCIEDWTISCEKTNNSRINNYSISGTITGCEKEATDDSPALTRIESAKTCLSSIKALLPDRIDCCFDLECPLHPIPTNESLTISPGTGTIQYNFTYDNRPINFIKGALSEQITINDNKPTEQIAEIPIIARRSGPLLFSCGSQPSRKKSVSINVVFPYDDCITCESGDSLCDRWTTAKNSISTVEINVEAFLHCIENDLIDDNDQVFRTQDTCSSSVIDCQYTRNVEWTYQSCSHDLPVAFEECESCDECTTQTQG